MIPPIALELPPRLPAVTIAAGCPCPARRRSASPVGLAGPGGRGAPARTVRGVIARHTLFLATMASLTLLGCQRDGGGAGRELSSADREQIAEAVEQRLRQATDLSAGGDVLERMLSLYPDTGRVVSASTGQVTTDRDSLAASIAHFWEYIGQNMRSPQWRWGPMQVDVLGPDAAAVTATYRIPHITPRGEPHVIGGAWTAVFARRDGRWVVVQEHLSDAPGPGG